VNKALWLTLASVLLVGGAVAEETPVAAEVPASGEDAFLVLLLSTGDDEAFDQWNTIEGAGEPTGIGFDEPHVVVTFRARPGDGPTAYLVGRWTRREAVFQEWLPVEREAVPVGIAAREGELFLLFKEQPGASGEFMLKEWDTHFGGWNEWKPAEGAVPVDVVVIRDVAYILLRRAADG
jgi:hypothetical protein